MGIKSREAFIAGLREVADFYEERPGLKFPTWAGFFVNAYTKTEMQKIARQIGSAKKSVETPCDSFRLSKTFASGIELIFDTSRSLVCRRLVVGTKDVPEMPVPAREQQVIPAHAEEIIEWQCDESLLAAVEGVEVEA
jgi:hypothetical protein